MKKPDRLRHLTADALLAVLIKRRIQLTPVLSRTGKVDWWSAGFRKVNRSSGRNLVNSTAFAHGKTPIEAVEKLLAGKTVMKMVRGRLINLEPGL